MNISDIQNEIIRLKKEKDICILAHSYQAKEILEVADFTGDSYKLSVDASKVGNKNIVMSGVRFMAETCKLLSPDKRVYLPNPDAGCSMADQMDRELIEHYSRLQPRRLRCGSDSREGVQARIGRVSDTRLRQHRRRKKSQGASPKRRAARSPRMHT